MIRPLLTVLHVNAAREHRGGQNQTRLLLAGLAGRADVRQMLIVGAGSRLAAEAAELDVRLHPVRWQSAVDRRALSVLRAFLSHDWDVIHAHDSHALQSVLLARTLVGARSPVVAARRVDFAPARSFVWQRADLVIAVSARVREVLLERGIDRRRVEVVYSGIDPRDVEPEDGEARAAALRAAARVAGDQPLVAAIGALSGHKDHATFVRAAAALASRHPDARFAVFGEGPERPNLERLIREHGLVGRFRLPGEFDRAARALGGVDVFVMPSKEEGLGTACIEAMLAGCPVVATDAGGLGELAVDGGFRPVRPRDPTALAAEIGRLLADPAARREAAIAARRGAGRFTAEAMVDGTLRCYRALLRRGA